MPVTLEAIANAAGYSVSTVSRALTNPDYPVSPATRKAITEVALAMGYKPKPLKRPNHSTCPTFAAPGMSASRWALRLRKLEWCAHAAVTVNGQPVESPLIDRGYIVLARDWQTGDVIELDLPMQPELIEANPRVDAVRDCVAIQRGPLIYCLEAADHPGINLMDVRVNDSAALHPRWREDPTLGQPGR